MSDQNWTEEDQKIYDTNLRKFCLKYENSMQIAIGKKCGYIFMFVREIEMECVDVAHNLEKEQAIFALEETLRMLKEND